MKRKFRFVNKRLIFIWRILRISSNLNKLTKLSGLAINQQIHGDRSRRCSIRSASFAISIMNHLALSRWIICSRGASCLEWVSERERNFHWCQKLPKGTCGWWWGCLINYDPEKKRTKKSLYWFFLWSNFDETFIISQRVSRCLQFSQWKFIVPS